MPSRASYSYVPRRQRYLPAALSETDMDVENMIDRDTIVMAAQLSRIVCRKLEVEAYCHLQKVLNQWLSLKPNEIAKFVRELGLILLTLRWRVSLRTLLNDEGTSSDPQGKEAFLYRVNRLCNTLYFYYCVMRMKLPSWCSKEDFRGKDSIYPGTSMPVYEYFPSEESIQGFDAWMLDGLELTREAEVESKMFGPRRR